MGASLWEAIVFDPMDHNKLLGVETASVRKDLVKKINLLLETNNKRVKITYYYMNALVFMEKKHSKRVDEIANWLKIKRVI